MKRQPSMYVHVLHTWCKEGWLFIPLKLFSHRTSTSTFCARCLSSENLHPSKLLLLLNTGNEINAFGVMMPCVCASTYFTYIHREETHVM